LINVVDTHALVWYFEGTDELGVEAGRILADESSALVVPTIVLAEAKYLATRKQLAVTRPHILERVKFDSRFQVVDFDLSLVERFDARLEMHDAIICATALLLAESVGEESQVLTRDRNIVASGLVPTVW
jgi:PIN domain nuclease of toxin-antitoxin system